MKANARTRKYLVSLSLIVIMLTLLSPALSYGDVIWTPPDSFYNNNYDKCEYLGRSFYANGRSGYVSVKREPGSKDEVSAIINGDIRDISFTYNLRGESWGVIVTDWADGSFNKISTGWVPMDQLILAYDKITFDEDHIHEYYEYSGDYSALFEVDELIFWTWPGSGVIAMTHDKPAERVMEPARNWLTVTSAYKDSEGREWGRIPYFYAHRDSWVCLSEPGNKDIPSFNPAPVPELYPSANPGRSLFNGGRISEVQMAIALVMALVIGSIVLIQVFWKR